MGFSRVGTYWKGYSVNNGVVCGGEEWARGLFEKGAHWEKLFGEQAVICGEYKGSSMVWLIGEEGARIFREEDSSGEILNVVIFENREIYEK